MDTILCLSVSGLLLFLLARLIKIGLCSNDDDGCITVTVVSLLHSGCQCLVYEGLVPLSSAAAVCV